MLLWGTLRTLRLPRLGFVRRSEHHLLHHICFVLNTHTHTRARARAHTHIHTHTHTHTHKHKLLQLYCVTWDFSQGKFGSLSLKIASCDRVALPNLRCMIKKKHKKKTTVRFHNPLNSDIDYRIFNMRMYSYCMRMHTGGPRSEVSSEGLLQGFRESAQNVDAGKACHETASRPCGDQHWDMLHHGLRDNGFSLYATDSPS